MSFSDGRHGPKEIAQMAFADHSSKAGLDAPLTVDQLAELIDSYGRVQYARGRADGYKEHMYRHHEMGQS
jgi:hypothetical protein